GRVSEAPPDGFSRMAAQAPDPGYALVGRVSEAPPDRFFRMAAQVLYPGQTLSQ
ncbi:TPA: hypothetical protein I8258_005231, partial [Kluyvera intermedia]|nr:hypothetical protein [Kluyvera intermedia]HAT2710724.1 hypothetical protein [Kluyvera intermedia]